MRKKSILINLMVCVFILFPSFAFCIGAEVSIGMWQQDPTGHFSYKGDSLDVEDELKYDTENKLLARAKIDMPLFVPNIYLMVTPMDFEEDGIKHASFRFGDRTFQADVPFKSELKLNQYDVALYYGIPFLHTATAGLLDVDVGLNIKVIDFYAKVEQSTLGLSESKSATIPIPMLYVGFKLAPHKFISFEGESRLVTYSGNSYYDFIGRIKLHPFGPVFVSGGYRYEEIKIDYSDVDSDVKFTGPFFEVGVSF